MSKTPLIISDSEYWLDLALGIQQASPAGIRVAVATTQEKLKSPGRIPCVKCLPSLAEQHDRILSLHCRRIFPPELIRAARCYNIHPGFLPWGRGWHPVTWSILRGHPAGATLHVMTEEVDAGPIIAQRSVPCLLEDTCYTLHRKVRRAERQLLALYWRDFVEDKLWRLPAQEQRTRLAEPRTKKDFEEACQISSLDESTVWQLVRKLAALTYDEGRSHAKLIFPGGEAYEVGIFLRPVEGRHGEELA